MEHPVAIFFKNKILCLGLICSIVSFCKLILSAKIMMTCVLWITLINFGFDELREYAVNELVEDHYDIFKDLILSLQQTLRSRIALFISRMPSKSSCISLSLSSITCAIEQILFFKPSMPTSHFSWIFSRKIEPVELMDEAYDDIFTIERNANVKSKCQSHGSNFKTFFLSFNF